MSGRRTVQVLLMLGGLLAWAVQFTVIYAVTSTLCGRGWADATLLGFHIVPATIVATTLLMLAATGILLLISFRIYRQVRGEPVAPADLFMSQASVLINGFSPIVLIWHAVPAFLLPSCA
ncbi:hypothetical protein AB4Y85_02090 [Microvirga sp. 2YAF29]|uniref:hypothetical protein n=1 Tax=Microvirga sp. 2YAF29 TaxID=3233031 RepID=UPI003F94A5F2